MEQFLLDRLGLLLCPDPAGDTLEDEDQRTDRCTIFTYWNTVLFQDLHPCRERDSDRSYRSTSQCEGFTGSFPLLCREHEVLDLHSNQFFLRDPTHIRERFITFQNHKFSIGDQNRERTQRKKSRPLRGGCAEVGRMLDNGVHQRGHRTQLSIDLLLIHPH
jgi:hypothetical protein